MMNDALAGMIPYDSIGLYEQPKPRFFFKMPRVVPEQKSKFESDELFRRLSRECEVSAFRFNFELKCDKKCAIQSSELLLAQFWWIFKSETISTTISSMHYLFIWKSLRFWI